MIILLFVVKGLDLRFDFENVVYFLSYLFVINVSVCFGFWFVVIVIFVLIRSGLIVLGWRVWSGWIKVL